MDALAHVPERLDRLESQVLQLRDEMRSEFSAVRTEIRTGDEETRAQMRALHEEVIGRLALIQEGQSTRARGVVGRRRKRTKKSLRRLRR